MNYYRVTFKNHPPIIVRGGDRNNAIKMAIIKTRGYLPKSEQRKNVVSAKLYKY